jgi:hypothetical protein
VFRFEDGNHGTLYTVSVVAKFKDGTYGENYEKQTLFLDYDQLPDLPLLTIETVDGQEPSYSIADKPDETLLGDTLTDNDYVDASLELTKAGDASRTLQVQIKVRGNTSSARYDKKSYKLQFDKAVDLLGNGTKRKEWALLKGADLNTYLGCYIGELCGMEWQPKMTFVNVMINGDWKGCYCLMEPVNKETAGEYVSTTGYIFENDAYWWNTDGIYFKTEAQIYQLGYTFKYPKINKSNDTRIAKLQQYMQEFENYILAGDQLYQNYIDEDSFAAWILARDILGTLDSAGSNMCFYIEDFDATDGISNKIKMGPLWDHDSIFQTEGMWSKCREGAVSYFPQLFEQESFYNAYVTQWDELSPDLVEKVKDHMDELYSEQDNAIDESWTLDAARWSTENPTLSERMTQALTWFETRRDWMNQELGCD